MMVVCDSNGDGVGNSNCDKENYGNDDDSVKDNCNKNVCDGNSREDDNSLIIIIITIITAVWMMIDNCMNE